MTQNIYMPTRVIYGINAVIENSSVLSEIGKKCLIVTGGSSAKKSGALDDVIKALEKENIEYIIFDEITANPMLSTCHKAGGIAYENKVDFIFGAGGGSILDASKAIAIFAANNYLEPEQIYLRQYENAPLKVVLMGTTAGTGSEVTGVSVLTNDSTMRKKSISGPDCYAAVSFCDPKYTYSMPYDITVSTALDAFAHAVEGYFTPKATGMIDVWAQECIPILYNALCTLYETKAIPDKKVREQLYKGSIYAGLIINTCGTAFPHPLGYILTENYSVSHGTACAVFFASFFERAIKYSPEKAEKLCKMCGAEDDELVQVISSLADNKIKITAQEAEKYAERWSKEVPKNFISSPGSLTKDEAVKILMSI